jgi:hypothetical protein
MTDQVGRPTIMTEETLQKLNEAFAFGCTDEEACFYADIGKSTLYNYQKENPEFVERKEALKERPILLARQSVVSALKDDPVLALKFLERKRKAEFSLRSELAGVKDQPLVDVADPQILTTLLKTAKAYQNASTGDPTPPEQD